MTVGEMLERIDSRELTEWFKFAELEPFGGFISDLRAGLAPAALLNVNRAAESPLPLVSPLQFYPWHQAPAIAAPPDETPEQIAANVRGFFDRLKGDDPQ